MKKVEISVENLSALTNKTEEEIVKASESEDGFNNIVSDFRKENQVFNLNDFAKLKTNLRKETIDNLTEEDIPESFKAKAVGWKLEKLESELKEKYQYDGDFKGLPDLVDKIVTKTKPTNDNQEEVVALKQRIVDLETDYNSKLKAKEDEYNSSLIKTDFGKSVNTLGLDYEGEVLTKQKGLLKAAFNDMYSLQRQDGKTVVVDREGNIVKDKKFDPVSLNEVMLGVAKEYGFQLKTPESGGHGGSSSKTKTGLKGVSWQEYAEKNNVKPNTEESDKLFIEWQEANK